MNHKELLNQFFSNIFNESGKIESRKSSHGIRNYLEKMYDL